MNDHPIPAPAEPAAAADLHGSLAQTLGDLTRLARGLADPPPPSTATTLTRLARELAEAAAMVRALPGRPPEPAGLIGAAAVRGLLTAVAAALDIPVPDTAGDEPEFLRLRSARAAEALRSLHNVLADPGRTELDYAWTAAWLTEALQEYPADGYAHSAMSS